MFKRRTTFVVGAGASCELGLPSGEQLMQAVLEATATATITNAAGRVSLLDRHLAEEARHNLQEERRRGLNPDWTRFTSAADRIQQGLPLARSIDNFLHSHREDEAVIKLGKAAIARVIILAERRSLLFEETTTTYLDDARSDLSPNITSDRVRKTWYHQLATALFSEVQKENIQDIFANTSFIIFNYDRCLEVFLWKALQSYFNIGEQEAADVLNTAVFLHPYGSVGPLYWQDNDEVQAAVPLGGQHDALYFEIAKHIKTFTETTEGEMSNKIEKCINNAEALIMVGFGYLEQNLKLLRPQSSVRTGAELAIGTAYGISSSSHPTIKKQLARLSRHQILSENIHVEPGTCSDLFRNYDLVIRDRDLYPYDQGSGLMGQPEVADLMRRSGQTSTCTGP